MKKSILIIFLSLQILVLAMVSTIAYFTYMNKTSIQNNQNVLLNTQERLSTTFTFMDNMTGKKPKEVAETSLSKGSKAPNFSLQDENEQEIKLEDYKGKKTLLVFSQEGCDYCEKFYPVLNAFLSQKEDVHVVVMQIGSTPAQNKIYKQQQDIQPTLLAATVNVVKNYKVEVTPTSVLLDEEGKIIASKGISELDELYDFVEKS